MMKTMMKTFVLLLLSLGLFDFAFGNHLRIFTKYDNEGERWQNKSLEICKQNNESLVTAYDKDDVTVAKNLHEAGQACWLGLQKRKSNITTWSNGELLTFNLSQVNITDENQLCEAMGNRMWEGFNCSERKPFMCYKGNNYKLIDKKKNWCQALQFCRRHYTDLVSISNETQNEEVFKKGENKTFWIGLQHDQWEWADKSCSTYRAWDSSPYTGYCTTTSRSQPDLLFRFRCTDNSKTLCAKGNVRIQVVRQYHTWEQALDYCNENHTGLLWIEDESDQTAVEQWLNNNTKAEGPFWIGLKQSTLFGFWIWSNRTVGYSNWTNGTIPEMPMSNHCGAITNMTDSWKWSDEKCSNKLYFLCEEEIVFMEKSAHNHTS